MNTPALPDNSPLDPIALAQLQRRMNGELLTPDSAAYEVVRRNHDQQMTRLPALIARCLTVHDVVLAIIFARERKLEFVASDHGLSAGGMLIDLSRMRQITVDPLQQIARVQPGVSSDELAQAAAAYGLGCGAALAVEIVAADGAIVTVSAHEHAEIFRATRDGEAGVVTATTYQLRPLDTV